MEIPEKKSSDAAAPSNTDGTPPAGSVESKPAPVLPASDTPKSPAPFGGHKGGKPTLSGFPVDSKEHADWKRQREAERSQRRRDEARAKLTPPPLPSRAPAPAGSVPPVFPGAVPVSLPPPASADSLPPVQSNPDGLVARLSQWSTGMLKKPAALFLRIVDRLRKLQFNRRLDKLSDVLTKEELSEVRRDLEWEVKARQDFEDSLAEVAALGLNKAGVSSEYAPYVNVCLSGGELVYAHLAGLDRLEKLIQLKLAAMKQKPVEEQSKA